MNRVLENYINPGYVYKSTQGPDVVRTCEDALQNGINCVSLAHLIIKDAFGHELSPELNCMELFRDRRAFEKVTNKDEMSAFDLAWFGPTDPVVNLEEFEPVYAGDGQLLNWSLFPVKHVAIYTGEKDVAGDHLFLHSSAVDGTNVVWPLRKFGDYTRYKKLYGITRFCN